MGISNCILVDELTLMHCSFILSLSFSLHSFTDSHFAVFNQFIFSIFLHLIFHYSCFVISRLVISESSTISLNSSLTFSLFSIRIRFPKFSFGFISFSNSIAITQQQKYVHSISETQKKMSFHRIFPKMKKNFHKNLLQRDFLHHIFLQIVSLTEFKECIGTRGMQYAY